MEFPTGVKNKNHNTTQSVSLYSDISLFENSLRTAKCLADSDLIPPEYQKNVPNCLIALEISSRINTSPLMVMQHLYIVHKKPAWSSQYIIAAINSSSKFEALKFEFSGTEGQDNWGCRAVSIEKSTNKRVEGSKITIAMAKAEGWVQKAGSKWKTMPEVMLRYRAASFFGKVHAPEILLGFQTAEEIIDITSDKKNEKEEIKKIIAEESKEAKLEEVISKETLPSTKPNLSEKQKLVIGIPEEIRLEAMKHCEITKLFSELTDEECEKIIVQANSFADK